MYTKEEALLLVGYEDKFDKTPTGVIGRAMACLGKEKNASFDPAAVGYLGSRLVRRIYKLAKQEIPQAVQLALEEKEQVCAITQGDLLNVAVEAARLHVGEEFAEQIIAQHRDMPVRSLITTFKKQSEATRYLEEEADKVLAEAQKSFDPATPQYHGIRKTMPTRKEAINEVIMSEIARFALYNRLVTEIDLNRSKVTKGNAIHICCSDVFANALTKARVPGVGQFKPKKAVVAAWPYKTPA